MLDAAGGAPSGEAALRTELGAWNEAGRALRLWWRDDDAVEDGPALGRLLDAAARRALPLALAVVPRPAGRSLARALRDRPNVAVLQHGFAHRNHAAEGGRAVECGGARDAEAVLLELGQGRAILAEMFGPRFPPVLVPPWNRIEPRIADALAARGYRGLSTFGPAGAPRADGLAEVNAHLDVLRWKGGARFAGRDKLLRATAEGLAARRLAGSNEPFGLLTHHLDHDEASWAFLEEWLALLSAQPGARWLSAAEAFGLEGPAR